jgi:hypothetical protein
MALPYVTPSTMEETKSACVCKDCAKTADMAAACSCTDDCQECAQGLCAA